MCVCHQTGMAIQVSSPRFAVPLQLPLTPSTAAASATAASQLTSLGASLLSGQSRLAYQVISTETAGTGTPFAAKSPVRSVTQKLPHVVVNAVRPGPSGAAAVSLTPCCMAARLHLRSVAVASSSIPNVWQHGTPLQVSQLGKCLCFQRSLSLEIVWVDVVSAGA